MHKLCLKTNLQRENSVAYAVYIEKRYQLLHLALISNVMMAKLEYRITYRPSRIILHYFLLHSEKSTCVMTHPFGIVPTVKP